MDASADCICEFCSRNVAKLSLSTSRKNTWSKDQGAVSTV